MLLNRGVFDVTSDFDIKKNNTTKTNQLVLHASPVSKMCYLGTKGNPGERSRTETTGKKKGGERTRVNGDTQEGAGKTNRPKRARGAKGPEHKRKDVPQWRVSPQPGRRIWGETAHG